MTSSYGGLRVSGFGVRVEGFRGRPEEEFRGTGAEALLLCRAYKLGLNGWFRMFSAHKALPTAPRPPTSAKQILQ